jgi:ABC-type nitrate/sulfonate/bicarbonate transport system substrate-binding protein
MKKVLGAFLVLFLFQPPAYAADKIRIGYPSTVGHFITLPLAQKKGFLKEEGIDYYAGVGPVVTAAQTRGHLCADAPDYADCTARI